MTPRVAIACGGTGGHLFPGLAVADELSLWGCETLLLISPKEVDQQAVKCAVGHKVLTLPAVGMSRGQLGGFLRGTWASFRLARRHFKEHRPHAVLAMGGFTSAPPVMAGRLGGAATFIHEANSIPGKANRWLAPWVDLAFVHFPSTVTRLRNQQVLTVGMPVRAQFAAADPAGCRAGLGLDPRRPMLLVMGGSQGASGVNDLVLRALPQIVAAIPDVQFLHLTGSADFERVQSAYRAASGVRAVVRPFLTEMELALGAATAAVTRAGASSIAELAAMRVPAVLIPYPHAADNHQLFNARALVDAGAALLLEQTAEPARLAALAAPLLTPGTERDAMRDALAKWHSPRAAAEVAERMLRVMVDKKLIPSVPPPPAAPVE